jgi:two-component system chemotaxis sensor kinase CheA
MVEFDVIVKEFVAESGEMLDQLERDLIALERNPSSAETLGSLFRSLHTIKGAAGFMGLAKLGALAHGGETVLGSLRDGSLMLTPTIASALLALSDCIRKMLSHVEKTGQEGDVDVSAIVERLSHLQNDAPVPDGPPVDEPVAPKEKDPQAAANSHVRVSVEQLDTLMNLVGELVIARNEIALLGSAETHSALLNTSQRLSAITTQLQEGIMKTRMQPIDHVWSKLPRVVRDAAQQCGKCVRVDMDGRDTELDRTLIEAIQGPLTHVVRNCVDHGLELPETRIAAGKPPEGRLSLRAFHEGGQVTIEVSDDGTGIDIVAIKRKALDRGLITPEQARGLSEQDAINLVFLPGLSTAATITSLSGRGVGMDVVKTNVEQIGGKVTIHSQTGTGTTLRMRIPLTLAIMTALVVANGDECYAIPQINVIELVRLEGEDIARKIEMMGDAAVYQWRDQLLPLIWLRTELTAAPGSRAAWPAAPDVVNIVVLQADGRKFGLIVDEVNDAQDIVVKPLGRHLHAAAIFAGATIMGNGRVVLILDVPAVALNAGVLSDRRDSNARHADIAQDDVAEPTEPLLLFVGTDDQRMAIPLSQITRIEEFAGGSLERDGQRRVVQYRGEILPLEHLAGLLSAAAGTAPPSPGTNGASVHALIHSNNGRQVGVVVDHILDTVDEFVSRLRPDSDGRLPGSLVIDGHATQILDLDAICSGAAVFRANPLALDGMGA